MLIQNNIHGFRTAEDSWEEAELERRKDSLGKLSFGIYFLDKALDGIERKDLVLVGSRTGVGKTELVTHMALSNCAQGKNVFFFALEAEEHEILNRITFKAACSVFYKSSHGKKLRYSQWHSGRYDDLLEPLMDQIEERVFTLTKGLHVFYRKDGAFGVNDLRARIISNKNNADLFIIDHLHYIDTEDENENKALTELTKEIRDLCLYSAKPTVLVSHVRKSDSRNKTPLPEIDDFHGSSNIPKIATKAIVLGPCREVSAKPWLFPTYMKIEKNRRDGSVTRYPALCVYDASQNKYEDHFVLGKFIQEKNEINFEPLPQDQKPDWAIEAENEKRKVQPMWFD